MLTFGCLVHLFMDNQNLIIGIGLPIVIFFIQLWLWMKDHKVCDITLIENRNFIIDPSLSNWVDGLFISYKDKPIKNCLLYYQVTVTNSGTKDISKGEVVSPLTLKMPDNVKLVSCKVFDQSKDLTTDISLRDNAILINWDLFRVGEYIRLDIVADYDSSLGEYKHDKHSLLSKITYNRSRIKDLKVQKTNIRNYEIFLRGLKTTVFIFLIPVFMSIIYNRLLNPNEPIDSYIPKAYLFFMMNIWLFIIIEQFRMRCKREKYGLVSDKPWNQFDIEDC